MSFRLVPKSVTVTRPCTSAELRQAPRCCLACRSPQGSVLGPKVFSQYAEDVADIFRRHNIHHHLFADEMQGHSSSLLMDAAIVTTQLSSCAKDICNWCEAKRLQLNASKTELLWFGTASQLRQLPQQCRTITINNTHSHPPIILHKITTTAHQLVNILLRSFTSRDDAILLKHLLPT